MRPLEQFIDKVKGQYNFWNTIFLTYFGGFSDLIHQKKLNWEKNIWNLETYMKSQKKALKMYLATTLRMNEPKGGMLICAQKIFYCSINLD